MRVRTLVAAFLFAIALAGPASASETAPSSQVAWRMLDYLAVDYPGAVIDGNVVIASEYSEMKEFAGSVRERIAGLPPSPAQPLAPGATARAAGAMVRTREV